MPGRLISALGAMGARAARAVAPAASAQIEPPTIVVVDFQGIIRDCVAAKSVQSQIDKLRASYQEEFVDIEEQLRAAEAELGEDRNTLSDEAFLQRRRPFERSVTEAQRKAQARRAARGQACDQAVNEARPTLLAVLC